MSHRQREAVPLASVKRGNMSDQLDLIVIGGGIGGLSVARETTTRFPRLSVAVLEKE
jgi:glycerol-3-phosphate dehydrogenase